MIGRRGELVKPNSSLRFIFPLLPFLLRKTTLQRSTKYLGVNSFGARDELSREPG